ncbi:MAG: hypothetical protein K2I16_02370 [Muribaculaceae bacterium]|nr:hypothetical protein [Muribaculaceae bacterium]MDE5712458.1 hypothetical protein [Muribaculaceae bacterium]
MKKVVLSLAVLFSVAMVSCGGNKAAEAQDSAATVVEEVAVEEVVVDSAAPADSAVVADSAAPAAEAAAAN